MIVKLILVGVASFAFVGLKVAQNLSSVARRYWAIMPLSIAIEVAGVYYIASIAHFGYMWQVVASSGVGAGAGCLLVTWLHHRGKT